MMFPQIIFPYEIATWIETDPVSLLDYVPFYWILLGVSIIIPHCWIDHSSHDILNRSVSILQTADPARRQEGFEAARTLLERRSSTVSAGGRDVQRFWIGQATKNAAFTGKKESEPDLYNLQLIIKTVINKFFIAGWLFGCLHILGIRIPIY